METLKKYRKELTGMIVFLLYFIQNLLNSLPLKLIGINYNDLSINDKVFYLLTYEAIFILIIIFIYKDTFTSNFKKYIKDFKNYIKKYFKYWAMAFGMMITANFLILSIAPNGTATNQQIINEILMQSPIYIIISGAIFAPILEETIFRLSLRNMFKNDKLFIVISGLVFGSLHVVTSFTCWQDLLYIIPYSIPGFVFAYTLVKSKNIFVPISLHFFHNTFTLILQFVLMSLL